MNMTPEDLKAAERRARVLAADMTIYPDIQRKIEVGIQNDTLFDELDGLLREARNHFAQYFSEDVINNTNILEKAFIDIVFAGTGHIDSTIW